MDDRFNRHRKPEGQEVKVSRDSAGNQVLLNRIAIDAESSPAARESLLETAHATASFRHPQVLTIREVRLEGDALVFVQDHPQGILLADFLEQGSPMPLSQGLNWMRQFAHALGEAQASGLTLSQICPSEFVVQGSTADDMSGTLLCLCPPVPNGWWLEVVDPIFASPEQKSGQACDIRSTMYSSGAVLGVMLTGRRPVGEAGWHNLLSTAGLPQRVNRALKAVLDTEPSKRCAHPAEWIALLDEALASIPVPSQEPDEAPDAAPTPAPVREAPPKRTVTPLAGRQPLAPSSLQGGAMFLSPADGRSHRSFLPAVALAGVMVVAAGVWQLLPKKAAPLPVAPAASPASAPLATVASTKAPSPPSEPPPPVVAAAPVASATPPAMPPSAPEVKTAPPPSASPEPPKLEAKAEAPKIPAPMPAPPVVAEVKPSPAPPPAKIEAKADAPKIPAPMPASPVVAEVKPSAAPPPAKIEAKADAPKIPAPMPTPPVVAEASPKPAVDRPAPPPVADTKSQPATKDELLKQAALATGPARSELYRKVLAADAGNPKALHALVEDALADPAPTAASRDELARWAGSLVSLDDPLGSHAQGSLALDAAADAKAPPAAIKILVDAVAKLKQSLHTGYPGSYDVLVRASINLHNAHLQNREKPKADRVSKALLEEIDHLPDGLPAADPRALGEEVEKQLKERAAKGPPRMQDAFLKTVMQHLFAIAAKRGDDQARTWLKTHR